VADVKKFAGGQVSFKDAMLTDNGNFKVQQQDNATAGPPAGPEENGVSMASALALLLRGTLMREGL
jgi:hypothetical protein